MDLKNSVLLLTQQAAMAVDYALIVGMIAVVIFCISIIHKARMAEELRQTGEKHDSLQMRYFNPAQKVVVQRPSEPESDETSRSDKTPRKPHPWRTRR
jgi:hypothetical protein